jgi:hypothetical protein
VRTCAASLAGCAEAHPSPGLRAAGIRGGSQPGSVRLPSYFLRRRWHAHCNMQTVPNLLMHAAHAREHEACQLAGARHEACQKAEPINRNRKQNATHSGYIATNAATHGEHITYHVGNLRGATYDDESPGMPISQRSQRGVRRRTLHDRGAMAHDECAGMPIDGWCESSKQGTTVSRFRAIKPVPSRDAQSLYAIGSHHG